MSSLVYLCPLSTVLQVLTDAGVPLGGALLWTYAAQTTTPVTTYQESTGTTPNSNPIQMNSAGRFNNVLIWQPIGVPLKLVFSTNAGTTGSPVFGTQIGPTFDNISGINDPTNLLANLVGATGSFTATLTGCTTAPTVTVNYALIGGPSAGYVTANVIGAQAVSNSTAFGLSNWAVGLQGISSQVISPLFAAEDNTVLGISASLVIAAQGGSAPIIAINNSTGNWTGSGTKGFTRFSFSYVLK
jgi:hypothetical protein